ATAGATRARCSLLGTLPRTLTAPSSTSTERLRASTPWRERACAIAVRSLWSALFIDRSLAGFARQRRERSAVADLRYLRARPGKQRRELGDCMFVAGQGRLHQDRPGLGIDRHELPAQAPQIEPAGVEGGNPDLVAVGRRGPVRLQGGRGGDPLLGH